MHKARVKLIWVVYARYGEPLLVDCCQLFDAFVKLLRVKERHVKVRTRVIEVIQVLISSESLQFSRLGILDNVDALMNADAIVQSCRGRLHLNWAVRQDLWSLPATFFSPIDAEHVIGEETPKYELISCHGLDLADICHLGRQICRPERILIGSLRLHRAKGSHEHGRL